MASAEQGSEKWSLMAIESAPYGVIVHDAQGKILIFNSQLETLSGYSKDEIPDIATWISKVYPDSDYRKIVLEQRNTKHQKNQRRVRDAIITRKDGEKRICEFSSVLSPSGIRTVFIKDTSNLRSVEDSLRESEERFRLLTEAAFEGIIIHMDGKQTYLYLKGMNPGAKVLLTTGLSMDGSAKEMLACGCNGFIQKPYRMSELSTKVSEILSAN